MRDRRHTRNCTLADELDQRGPRGVAQNGGGAHVGWWLGREEIISENGQEDSGIVREG